MLNRTYEHTLTTNPRYLAAQRTSQRSGPAMEGNFYRPRRTRGLLVWLLLAAAFYAFVAVVVWGGMHA